MNLHITNDTYGLFPCEIAKRIKKSINKNNNVLINLGLHSVLKDNFIIYLDTTEFAFRNYIKSLKTVDKIFFHPYTFKSYQFLKVALTKFPSVQVYWMCWSYDIYNLDNISHSLYEPFSKTFMQTRITLLNKFILSLKKYVNKIFILLRLKEDYSKTFKKSHYSITYFCSFLPSDFAFFKTISPNHKIKYLPFAYLSLENIMPHLYQFISKGNKIMIGHSSSETGNHYEIIQSISSINPDFSIFLPLAYGNKEYAEIIKTEAQKNFKNLEILQEKIDSIQYYNKLTEVGWALINTKVQEGLGNITALIWMGVKVFLNNNTSTYIDFTTWGIKVFSIQNDINENELTSRLSAFEIENNRTKIFEKMNEKIVSRYWDQILN